MPALRQIVTVAASIGALCIASPAMAQSAIEGDVRLRRQQERPPFAHVFVALDTATGQPAAITRTGADGRYAFTNIPPGRYVVHASKPGYIAARAAGREGSKIVVDCRTTCAEKNADFEFIKGSVIAGAVIDGAGQPVFPAHVKLRQDVPDDSPIGSSNTTTDDRGKFRFAGVAAGAYCLTITPPRKAPAQSTERRIEITDGEQETDLTVRLGEREQLRVAGRLSGVPLGEGVRSRLSFQPAGHAGLPLNAAVGANGAFTLDPAPAGRYLVSYTATSRETFEPAAWTMGVLDVRNDMVGVPLQPVETATASGTIRFTGARLPARPIVEFISNDGFGSRWSRVSSDGRFQAGDLLPGSYRVEGRSKGFYIKGVESGSNLHPPGHIQLASGSNEFMVVAATDYGQVKGTVRDFRSRDPLPHARVALQAARGTLQTLADQAGRFVIGEVIPGEYRICAWADLPSDEVADESSWERAGCANKYIPIDPDSEIEIELSAAP